MDVLRHRYQLSSTIRILTLPPCPLHNELNTYFLFLLLSPFLLNQRLFPFNSISVTLRTDHQPRTWTGRLVSSPSLLGFSYSCSVTLHPETPTRIPLIWKQRVRVIFRNGVVPDIHGFPCSPGQDINSMSWRESWVMKRSPGHCTHRYSVSTSDLYSSCCAGRRITSDQIDDRHTLRVKRSSSLIMNRDLTVVKNLPCRSGVSRSS